MNLSHFDSRPLCHWVVRRDGAFWGFDEANQLGWYGLEKATIYACAVSPAANMSLNKGEELVEIEVGVTGAWSVKGGAK